MFHEHEEAKGWQKFETQYKTVDKAITTTQIINLP